MSALGNQIGARLKEERERLGLTQQTFSALAGAGKRTLITWESGETSPNAVQLSALAAAGVDALYLLTGNRTAAPVDASHSNLPSAASSKNEEEPRYRVARARPDAELEFGDNRIDVDDYLFVPQYDIAALAGSGAHVGLENVIDYMAFRREWIVSVMGLDISWLALARVEGDSMQSTLSSGDLVLLDRRPRNRITDGIYFVDLGDGLIVKRLQLMLDGSVDVISDNNLYRNENVSGEKLKSMQLSGKVVWHGRRL